MSDKQYDETNRGVLFKNQDKQKDTHADYRGRVNVNGKEFWLDAWLKQPHNGGPKFLSISVKAKDGSSKKQDEDL